VMACEEGAYLMGMLAAMMTETNVIGVVGGFEQPSITKELEAFKAAAKAYNPDITVLSAYVNSFTDVTAGQSAATAMINQNADVLYHVANQAGTGVINAAAESDIYVMGNSYDQSSIAPEVLLCSTVYSMPNVILQAYADIEAGTFGNSVTNLGFKEGIVDLAFNEALLDVIGAENVTKIEQAKEDIVSGKIDVPLIETPSE
ncbi:MAG: BMP family ABC transporter substrate-binding protein, partial [Clostridiaceae bacterium]|nr:BMP family ABC transporter substrate-binding protein [Clostridiaceae bacterium]